MYRLINWCAYSFIIWQGICALTCLIKGLSYLLPTVMMFTRIFSILTPKNTMKWWHLSFKIIGSAQTSKSYKLPEIPGTKGTRTARQLLWWSLNAKKRFSMIKRCSTKASPMWPMPRIKHAPAIGYSSIPSITWPTTRRSWRKTPRTWTSLKNELHGRRRILQRGNEWVFWVTKCKRWPTLCIK